MKRSFLKSCQVWRFLRFTFERIPYSNVWIFAANFAINSSFNKQSAAKVRSGQVRSDVIDRKKVESWSLKDNRRHDYN